MTPEQLDLLIDDYLDGRLSAQQRDLFEQDLLADPAAMDRLIAAGAVHRLLQDRYAAEAQDGLHDLIDLVGVETPQPEQPSVMDMVVDQALAERRKHEVEDEANQRLAAQQAEDARERRFELRRLAEPEPVKGVFMSPRIAVAGAIAAVLLIAAGVLFGPAQPDPPRSIVERPAPSVTPNTRPNTGPRDTAPTPTIDSPRVSYSARVSDSVDAQWDGLSDPSTLEAGVVATLSSGFAQIEFADRGTVLVQGPAAVEVVDTGTLRLVEGRVVARSVNVTAPLTIFVDNTALRGVGAEFAVSSDSRTQATTLVFAGSIDVTSTSPTAGIPATRLNAGYVASLSTQRGTVGHTVSATTLQSTYYSRSIDGVHGRPAQLSATVHYLADPPNSLYLGELVNSQHVWLFRERRGVHLDDTVYRTVAGMEPTQGVFYAGQTLDSYLLHMDPVGDGEGTPTVIEGSITFDRPIHAVIGGPRMLHTTDRLFGLASLTYPRDSSTAGGAPGSQLSWGVELATDSLTLSRDRRTLYFRVQATSSLDQARILVEAETQPN